MKIKLRTMWIIQFISLAITIFGVLYPLISDGSKNYSIAKMYNFYVNTFSIQWISWMILIAVLSLSITSFVLGIIILSSQKPLNAKGICIATGILGILMSTLSWITIVGIGLNLSALIVSLIAIHKVKKSEM